MSQNSNIEWTEATWNPWHGCHKVSPGCKHCYMFRDKARYGQDPNVVVRSKTTFFAPEKWKDPKLIFTCSWSDWLIEEADPWRDEAYEVIRATPRHTYQILTKRPERFPGRVPDPPLPNVWLGVSVESRDYLHRIDYLRRTPAAVRFLSLEPLLEDLGDISRYLKPEVVNQRKECGYYCDPDEFGGGHHDHGGEQLSGIDWVIVGGESGKGARPCDIRWIASIVDQCRVAQVPVFVKQLGSNAVDMLGRMSGAMFSKTDKKGSQIESIPHHIRIRQMPELKCHP
jgi:protein gp37